MSKSFVEFYSKNDISPVSQDIKDLNKHFQRRESLFRSLGLLPAFISGKSVLEFGPGSGHNTLYMASLKPERYELVDGNLKGVQETRERLAIYSDTKVEVHLSLFEEFQTDTRFHLVWAEGCLPHNSEPLSLLDYISLFVAKGGGYVLSTANGISYLSEILRRLFRDRFFTASGDVHEQALQVTPYMKLHLQYLRGMSRPVEDWILDNIVQPLQYRKLLSIPDVIASLDKRFDVYGSSPCFLTDWRWYKDIVGENRGFNNRALESYYTSNLNLLDYRFEFSPHSQEFGKKLEELGSQSWDMMCRIEKGEESVWQELFLLLQELCAHVEKSAPETSEAIREAMTLLQSGHPDMELNHFPQWWGRGQQYLSLIRKDN